ncbi:hypothetical protein PAXINDRAFT_158739 [Paxillus involutus ATCC 200175]|uniref:Uncharacterized protein n=1 Tax=Paxillus involutus ATCC 200175 TaxID=664439 RepID=A0A0C9SV15_PAXIN|nr:hypothetical protein PAXINDRAFT_158739 [Paxillus involutus ATCC 200175]
MISGEVASHVVAAISPHIANLLKTADQMEANVKEVEKIVERTNGQELPAQTPAPNANTLSYSNADGSPDLNIKAITKLKNGGLILELDSATSARWIREEENRDRFLNALGTPAEMKNRVHSVIVPFVPISSPIEDTNWLRALELENNLPDDSINLAKWVKPKNKRAQNQRVAHVVLHFNDPHPANKVLKEALDARHPENSMPYFPTNESWTQVLLPPKPMLYRKQLPMSAEPKETNDNYLNLRQTTLDYGPSRNIGERQRTMQPPPPTREYPGTRGVGGTRGIGGSRSTGGTRGQFSPASSSNRIPVGSQRQGTQRTITSFLSSQQTISDPTPIHSNIVSNETRSLTASPPLTPIDE